MTETMPRTSAENLHQGTKTVYCHIKFLPRHCKVEIHTQTKQAFKQFDMHAEFNIFLDQKSPACKLFISTIQTLNLSLHCTYPKLSCSMEVMQVSISSITIPTPRTPGDLYQNFAPIRGFCILAFARGAGICWDSS